LTWARHSLLEGEENSPLEDYFGHLCQNGINFLSSQLLLFGLHKKEKSGRGEVFNTHVLDHFPGQHSKNENY